MNEIVLLLGIGGQVLVAQTAPVHVVLFTHIEDNMPVGTLGSQQSKDHYALVRGKMIEMADLASINNVKWSFQPDWKILLAALMYEDSLMRSSTRGKNFLRYMKEDLGASIDPHSHENSGYNYTDVAHLLDSLGIGGSTVIGGHIWDPFLPQFSLWDRFRVPVRGQQFPWALWRGDVLMGSGTPNHVNDPVVSGVWRPKDRYHYFVDDTAGNIACVGQYKSDIPGISELIALQAGGEVPADVMLTSSYHIKPADITAANVVNIIDSVVIKPLKALRDRQKIVLTDFTTLVSQWRTVFRSKSFLLDSTRKSYAGIQWKKYLTLAPGEGTALVVDSSLVVNYGGVPVITFANDSSIILSSTGNEQMQFFTVRNGGRTLTSIPPVPRGPDGGCVYLPDGRSRFLTEEPAPSSTPQRRRSRVISWISSDGKNWTREPGIRYQPGPDDDSIASVVCPIQVQDSLWRLYYVGDFYRANGVRTAISTDWGLTWRAESGKNIMKRGDVDPHPVYLTGGGVRLYVRTGFSELDPAKRGISYCDSDDGVTFDTTRTKLLLPDDALPNTMNLDPSVIRFDDGTVACYFGAAPAMNQTQNVIPQLRAAFSPRPAETRDNRSELSRRFVLHQNYPNPFNPTTTIEYTVGGVVAYTNVRLAVYDILGREVAVLVNERKSPGVYEVRFDASGLPSGVYFYTLRAGEFRETKQMTLLK